MIAQIIILILITIGLGMNVGKIKNNSYKKVFDVGSAFFGMIIVFLLFWWGGLFDQHLNIFGWLLIGMYFFSLGTHISKNGETKTVTNATTQILISFFIEVALLYGSGFLDPLFY